MKTGVVAIDKLIQRHGIQIDDATENAFQKNISLMSGYEASRYQLPFCMFNTINNNTAHVGKFTLLRFYLPHRQHKRFAYFLLDNNLTLIEQVCFAKDVKHKKVFSKLKEHIVGKSKSLDIAV